MAVSQPGQYPKNKGVNAFDDKEDQALIGMKTGVRRLFPQKQGKNHQNAKIRKKGPDPVLLDVFRGIGTFLRVGIAFMTDSILKIASALLGIIIFQRCAAFRAVGGAVRVLAAAIGTFCHDR